MIFYFLFKMSLLSVFSVTLTIFYFMLTVSHCPPPLHFLLTGQYFLLQFHIDDVLLSVYNVTLTIFTSCLQCHIDDFCFLFTVSLLSVYSVTSFCLQCHIFLCTVSHWRFLLSVYSVTTFCLQCHYFLFTVSHWRSLRHGHQGDLWDGTRRVGGGGDRSDPYGLHPTERDVPVQGVQENLSSLSELFLRSYLWPRHETQKSLSTPNILQNCLEKCKKKKRKEKKRKLEEIWVYKMLNCKCA